MEKIRTPCSVITRAYDPTYNPRIHAEPLLSLFSHLKGYSLNGFLQFGLVCKNWYVVRADCRFWDIVAKSLGIPQKPILLPKFDTYLLSIARFNQIRNFSILKNVIQNVLNKPEHQEFSTAFPDEATHFLSYLVQDMDEKSLKAALSERYQGLIHPKAPDHDCGGYADIFEALAAAFQDLKTRTFQSFEIQINAIIGAMADCFLQAQGKEPRTGFMIGNLEGDNFSQQEFGIACEAFEHLKILGRAEILLEGQALEKALLLARLMGRAVSMRSVDKSKPLAWKTTIYENQQECMTVTYDILDNDTKIQFEYDMGLYKQNSLQKKWKNQTLLHPVAKPASVFLFLFLNTFELAYKIAPERNRKRLEEAYKMVEESIRKTGEPSIPDDFYIDFTLEEFSELASGQTGPSEIVFPPLITIRINREIRKYWNSKEEPAGLLAKLLEAAQTPPIFNFSKDYVEIFKARSNFPGSKSDIDFYLLEPYFFVKSRKRKLEELT